jgi:hypothetical protein
MRKGGISPDEQTLGKVMGDLRAAEGRARTLVDAATLAAETGLGAKTRAAFAEALVALDAVAAVEARAEEVGMLRSVAAEWSERERLASLERIMGGRRSDPASVAREILEHMNTERE